MDILTTKNDNDDIKIHENISGKTMEGNVKDIIQWVKDSSFVNFILLIYNIINNKGGNKYENIKNWFWKI